MSNTGIQSFNGQQNNASEFLKEHFCVHQSEEKAVSRLANRMTESIKAIVPDIMERIHTIVQVNNFYYVGNSQFHIFFLT